jgi:hypothetical protein
MWHTFFKFWIVLGMVSGGVVLEAASAEPAIVFIHIGPELPPYLETAIHQARLFNKSCPIILVANQQAIAAMPAGMHAEQLQVVPCETLQKTPEHIAFLQHSPVSKGFWLYTSERFLYLDDLIRQYQLENVFHLENDNMLYVDLDTLLPIFQAQYPGIAATFDNDQRCIAGLIYMSNQESTHQLASYFAQQAKHGYNDMQLLALFKDSVSRDILGALPIIPKAYADQHPLKSASGHTVKDSKPFYNHVDQFHSIFDAAAIGQYLGGGDTVLHPHVKPGFINESCIFNPSLFTYKWRRDSEGRKVPYAIYEGRSYRINNLHVHSKQLHLFSSQTNHPPERSSSFPYMSGDTFRSYCDYIVDETAVTLIPEQVKAGETIFLKTDYLEFFFNQLHPRIANKYILVTHNSDRSFPGPFAYMLEDPKLMAWFGQNLEDCQHPKLHPIPIGLANRCWPHGSVDNMLQVLQSTSTQKKTTLLYMNFQPETYPLERAPLYKRFKKKSFCTVSKPTDFKSYLMELTQAKFVLSPRGNGLDCHRTWEALWMGAIPIVKSSSLDPLFAGLPVLIVNDWKKVTQEFLEEKWEEMNGKEWLWDRLEATYWFNLISYLRNMVLMGCDNPSLGAMCNKKRSITVELSDSRRKWWGEIITL